MSRRLNIAICDDVAEDAESLKKLIINEQSNIKFGIEITCYTSPVKLLENIEQIQAVFLDWMMDELDGRKTAEQIRKRNPRCLVIAETGCGSELFHEIVEANVITYIGKPFHYISVRNALKKLEEHLFILKKLQFYYDYEKYLFSYPELTLISAYDGYAVMDKNGIRYRMDKSLVKIYEEEVDTKQFALLNRNSLFYLGFIKEYSYERGYVLLKNDVKINIPESQRRDFRKRYAYFDTHIKSVLNKKMSP